MPLARACQGFSRRHPAKSFGCVSNELKEERPEGFVEKIWSFLPTFGTVSTEMKRTQIFPYVLFRTIHDISHAK
jgi:hypothetical protein